MDICLLNNLELLHGFKLFDYFNYCSYRHFFIIILFLFFRFKLRSKKKEEKWLGESINLDHSL